MRSLETVLDEKEEEFSKNFITSLEKLHILSGDLSQNYEVIKHIRFQPGVDSHSNLGSYYDLTDKLKQLTTIAPPDLFTIEDYILKVQFFTTHIRDMLRTLVVVGAHDSALLLELLWKLFIKILD